ncbi:hypothetical protein [Culturomica massiliensis]|uniref:hypothetical protein n=1 Tax=Culturomica massiliensis TaxID=1841857 RepID=UPI0011DD6AF1|nr:hypothetical protein [Culturomica massiliensis]
MEKMLVAADKALQSTGILKKNNEGVWLVDKSEYEAYLAGFGAIVINLGLKSAIIYYHNSRKIILTAIGEVLSEFPERNLGKNAEELKEMVVREDLRLNDHIQWIVDASVALKMMIRTYGIKKDK